jgi:hypothetical protein
MKTRRACPGWIAKPVDIWESKADEELMKMPWVGFNKMRKMKERAKSGMIEGR